MNFGDRLAVPLCLLCAVAACERGDDDASGPSDDDQAADDDQADDDVADDDAANPEIALTDWRLSSADGIADGGAAISQVGYDDAGWNAATVPATVLAALVADGVYPDPYYGVNLHELPGMWPMGFDVSVFPMPSDSPFRRPWWHRAEFHAPVASPDDRYWLRFEGLNFRADLWLNGRRVADRKQVAGAFREYEFDVTDFVRSGADNALAAEIIAPTVHDLAYNWVDWGPGPPDKNMGLYRAVKLLVTGPVALRYPQVVSKLELPGMASARLTVFADLWNGSAQPVDGVLHGELEGVEFSQAVSLTAGERRRVELAPGDHPELVIDDPRVWWPLNLGEQNLYQMTLDFRTGEKISDRQTVSFGIRDVQAPLTEEGCRYFAINGRKVLIRGAAWAPDLLLRESPARLEAEIRYAADLGLNMIRSEGKFEVQRFYDLCDRYGVMIMSGWCCCDHWQFCETWNDEDYVVAGESLRNQIHQLRNHPSVVVWLNGSDDPPSPDVERMYIDILEEENWPMPYLSSADDQDSEVTGPTGVKMVGPYDYVPPDYWLEDTRFGGAFGFNTETNPGEVIPPVENLLKFLPPEHLWPIDEYWLFHAGRGYYLTLHPFNQAMDQRYGGAASVEEYVRKSQVLDYDNHRAMFEAWGRNKYHATGVIQFLLNGAWPNFLWRLYDYYLFPAGAYFGSKKALEPLHVQYSYDDGGIDVVNSLYAAFSGVRVSATILDFDLTARFHREKTISIEPDGVARAFVLPKGLDLTTTYFLALEAADAGGEILSRNFYWLSTRPVIFGWNFTFNERKTPVLQEADLTMLNSLPAASLNAGTAAEADDETGWERRRVTVENLGDSLAFFVQLRLMQGADGDDVTPVLWEDNDLFLLPGESREVVVRWQTANLQGHQPAVEVSAWNAAAFVIE